MPLFPFELARIFKICTSLIILANSALSALLDFRIKSNFWTRSVSSAARAKGETAPRNNNIKRKKSFFMESVGPERYRKAMDAGELQKDFYFRALRPRPAEWNSAPLYWERVPALKHSALQLVP